MRLAFAEADDGDEPGAVRGRRLRAHQRVAFAVVGAALGVADDDVPAAGVGEHFGAHVAGVRARLGGVAVLTAESDDAVL